MAPETPKGVSSRLLTMKFMQRAAAAAAASASNSVSPDPDVSSSKKRKLDSTPPGRINPNIDQALIQAALDEQEAIRLAALEKHSAADTHWVLNPAFEQLQSRKTSHPLNVVYVGYGEIDSEANGESANKPMEGRTSTKSSGQVRDGTEASENDDESSHSSAEESDDARRKRKESDRSNSANTTDRSRSQSVSRLDREALRAKEFRVKRKRKEVRLNELTSISAAGSDKYNHRSHSTRKQ